MTHDCPPHQERLERLGTRAAKSFRNQKLNSGFVTWRDMARVRRHQRRRAAGVLHSLRDLRVRRALNSWLELAASRKASKRAVAGALFGMRHHRVLRALNSWIEMSDPRRTACKCSQRRHPPPFQQVRSTRGWRCPISAGRRSAVCARPSTSCAAAACAPAGTGGVCASTPAVAIAVSSRAYATEVCSRHLLDLMTLDCG